MPKARKPNEESDDKKHENAKPVAKDEQEDFFYGKSEKAKRERQRKEKDILDIDIKYLEPQISQYKGGRGGRARGRGDQDVFRGRDIGRGDGFEDKIDSGFCSGGAEVIVALSTS